MAIAVKDVFGAVRFTRMEVIVIVHDRRFFRSADRSINFARGFQGTTIDLVIPFVAGSFGFEEISIVLRALKYFQCTAYVI